MLLVVKSFKYGYFYSHSKVITFHWLGCSFIRSFKMNYIFENGIINNGIINSIIHNIYANFKCSIHLSN